MFLLLITFTCVTYARQISLFDFGSSGASWETSGNWNNITDPTTGSTGLIDDQLNLTEISYRLNYSSIAHLSSQFKKVTDHTPTYFKKLGRERRNNLENL